MSPRLVAVTHSATFPPRRGVQVRNAELFRGLARHFDVDSYSLTFQRSDLPLPRGQIVAAPHWNDHRSRDPLLLGWTVLLGRAGYPPAYSQRLLALLPRRRLRRALAGADAVIVSPPYHFEWVRANTPRGVPVVFDEHSVEADMYRPRASRWSRLLTSEVARAEREAARGADLVLVTCAPDAETMQRWGAERVTVVPNGADLERFRPPLPGERTAARAALGLEPAARVAVFVGSGHPPNVEAVVALEAEAAAFAAQGIELVLAGRSSLGRAVLPGVRHLGEVEDVATLLHAADLTLCPLKSGSGTSIKVVEYLAAGVPVVSTDFGVRGLGVQAGVHYARAELGHFASVSAGLLADPAKAAAMATAAREVAEARFSWRHSADLAAQAIQSLLATRRGDG